LTIRSIFSQHEIPIRSIEWYEILNYLSVGIKYIYEDMNKLELLCIKILGVQKIF
jgi:hypothetical protein